MSQRYITRGFTGILGVLIVILVPGAVLNCATAPPEGAVTAELGFPPVETTWVTRIRARGPGHAGEGASKRVHQEGTVFNKTSTVLEESTHNGRPVQRVRDGSKIHLIDKATGNGMAYVRERKEFTYGKAKDDVVVTISEGEELVSFSPYLATYNFPLWVGKSWTTPYTYADHNKGTTAENVWRGKVSAYEEVTVPAGTFKTFKVEGTDGNIRLVSWYAPRLHVNVKGSFEWKHEKRNYELIKYVAK